ncbi:MAG: hypothetical protein ACLFV8_06290 [Alphaproteobacteria bacterium]
MFKSAFRVLLLGVVAVFALQGAAQAEDNGLPVDTRHLVMLTKTAIIAVNQANQTGNYAVLRELAAPSFRDKNSVKDLEKIFAKLRQSNLDLSPIVIYNPQFANTQITSKGFLRLTGHFPTKPLQVNFNLLFQPVGGQWRLLGVSLNPAKRGTPVTELQ